MQLSCGLLRSDRCRRCKLNDRRCVGRGSAYDYGYGLLPEALQGARGIAVE